MKLRAVAAILGLVGALALAARAPVGHAADKGSIRTFTDGTCLLADGFVDAARIAAAKEVRRAGGCVTYADGTGEFHVLEIEVAKGAKPVCGPPSNGRPKAPTTGGMRAGAGEDC